MKIILLNKTTKMHWILNNSILATVECFGTIWMVLRFDSYDETFPIITNLYFDSKPHCWFSYSIPRQLMCVEVPTRHLILKRLVAQINFKYVSLNSTDDSFPHRG